MKQIEIKGVQYNLPTSWMDITLNQFLKFKEVDNLVDKLDYVEYTYAQIESLTSISTDTLDTFTVDELALISSTVSEIISGQIPVITDIKVLNNDIQISNKPYFILNGELFILDISTWQMWISQYSALDIFTQSESDIWKNAHKIAACIWRSPDKLNFIRKYKIKKGIPINFNNLRLEDFNASKMQINSEYFYNEMPMPYINTAVVFFCFLRRKSQEYINIYTEKRQALIQKNELRKKMEMHGSATKNDGTGTRPSVFSRKKI